MITDFPFGVMGFPMIGGDEKQIFGANPSAGANSQNIFFVNTSGGSDNYDGLSPATAKKTIGGAVAVAAANGIIYVAPGTYSENVTVAVQGLTIIGVGANTNKCSWNAADGTKPNLTVNASNVRVAGFRFASGTTGSAIQLNRSASTNSQQSVIYRCEFNTGQYAIESAGGASGVEIYSCIFHDMTAAAASAGAIISTSTAVANPQRWIIQDCYFVNNKNHIILPGDDVMIKNCVFQAQGHSITTTAKINLSGGNGFNVVAGCFLGGTYSIVGGYTPGTTDSWMNWTVAGITTANPA